MTAEQRRTVAVVAGAFALRLVLLAARGDYLVYDESYYLLLARSLREGHGFTLNGLPHVALSPLQPLLVAGLSLLGLPDLTASRNLTAGCGALLVVPVSFLARRWCGERAGRVAGLFVAVSPALVAFLPFFPGERWNLYFGSEPLYLLLAMSAVAAAVRAVNDGGWGWWLALGGLLAAAYLARLEGAVLGAALAIVIMAVLVKGRRWWVLPRAITATVLALALAAPYLLYLRSTLGRWAVSGRVQAAAVAEGPGRAAAPSPAGRSDAVRSFVWRGDREALWRTLYALDAGGRRMASQYWGVAPRGGPSVAESTPRRPPPRPQAPPATDASGAGVLLRAVLTVLPWWFLALALAGAAWRPAPRGALVWSLPILAAALVPAALAYVEPRVLLLLVPLAVILAARATVRIGEVTARRPGYPRALPVAVLAVVVLLLIPTARDLARAWRQDLPLQRVASGRRAVGTALAEALPEQAIVMSWHPAVAIWARREWRVLPYDDLNRVFAYARHQRAAAVVLSTFEPSPLRESPRAFTVILTDVLPEGDLDSARLVGTATPLMFVGRFQRAEGAP